MYIPEHFAESRPDVLHRLMRNHPFATLVTQSGGRLDANHVPLLFSAAPGPLGSLRGHVARANPVWRETPAGAEVLAIFHGPDAYISPSSYPTKAEHGRVVPTWNYAVVHARGSFRAIDDAAWLRALVGELTARHEAGRPAPWRVEDAPAEYIEKMLAGIVGIEIVLTGLEGKWKVSQNQPAQNRVGVTAALRADGDAQARAMADMVESANKAP